MSCISLYQRDVVILEIEIELLPEIPVDTQGTVLEVREEQHEIDVFFDGFGIYRGLPAHSFAKLRPGPEKKKRTHTAPVPHEHEHEESTTHAEKVPVLKAVRRLAAKASG